MKENISLLYIANVPLPNERANGVQITHTCEGLAHNGIAVTLLTRRPQGIQQSLFQYYNVTESFRHRQVRTFDIPFIPFRYALRNISFFLIAQTYIVLALFKTFFTGKKLVVYVRGETVLPLIPLTYAVPVFFETHQIRNHESFYKMALKRVKGVVVITESLKQKFVEAYGLPAQKILMVRDSVDVEKFKLAERDKNIWLRYGIPSEKKIVLYSGTLAPEKGVETLALAGTFIREDAHIVFLGGTEEQITAFRNVHGHIKNISIIGRVDHVDVPKYLASADAFVLPDSAKYTYSNLYTSPMKLFEYMASEHPIVASKVPSLLEVLDDETAVFFDADDAESLGNAINSILSDEQKSRTLSSLALERVSAFTWEKRTKAIVAHILGIIQ